MGSLACILFAVSVGLLGECSQADEMIAQDEGFRGLPYEDTTGHLTIGYGTKLPLTKEEAMLLLHHRLEAEVECIKAGWPGWDEAPQSVRNALTDAGYALGCHGLLGFHDALAALERREYHKAASAFRASLWYQQEPHRVDRVIAALRGLPHEDETQYDGEEWVSPAPMPVPPSTMPMMGPKD